MAAIAEPAAQADQGPVGSRSGAQTRKAIVYGLLIAYALLMFVPFAWSLATSFKTLPESVQVTFLPRQPTLEGYVIAWTEMDPTLPRLFLNSFIIAGAITLLNLILDSLGGYAFARLRFPGREILFVLVLATLMIPDPLRVVPVYTLLVNVGLVGRGPEAYAGLIIISAVSATGLFLMRQYFMSIPRELEEAARIDGAGHLQTYWRVILPLAGPALAAVAILTFQGSWNSLFWPIILIRDRSQWVLPQALSQFSTLYSVQWNALMAVVVLATLPIVILYVFFQRYFVEGIAATGVKG